MGVALTDSNSGGSVPPEFQKVMVQVTLLFGADTRVMLPSIGKTLGRLHHRVDHKLAGIRTKQDITGRWLYPPLDVAITEVGLEEVETYVLCLQNTIAQYIATHLILETDSTSNRRLGSKQNGRGGWRWRWRGRTIYIRWWWGGG